MMDRTPRTSRLPPLHSSLVSEKIVQSCLVLEPARAPRSLIGPICQQINPSRFVRSVRPHGTVRFYGLDVNFTPDRKRLGLDVHHVSDDVCSRWCFVILYHCVKTSDDPGQSLGLSANLILSQFPLRSPGAEMRLK